MAFRTYTLPVLTEPTRAGADIDSYEAENTVKQGQVVKQGTNEDQCTPADTEGERVVGVAMYDASAGDTVDVIRRANAVRLTADSDGGGSISADTPLRVANPDGSTEEGEVDAATSSDFVLGTSKRDADGDGDDIIADINLQGGSGL